uniref:chloroplast enveloppe membrane protein n=1 Tax=Streptofilum capillatum TaxID=2058781 RepID=UPI00286A0D5E|nr:chloroplast enveloppe membrane protein [Streptofilum capillatum]WKT08518.1 chloroplast enveloppe membrane protein [Streptofilum capillatum]WKT08618.1 chloroplast enveloppe membrane protein [Streptofilum sp. BC4-VF8pt]WKT08717.1 chloroplast enveloppe membrane protein [Streptofilum sp. ZNP2-VF4pt]
MRSFFQWVLQTPDRAISKAYAATQNIKQIKKEHLFYTNQSSTASKKSNYVTLYLQQELNKNISCIRWKLLEFQISNFLVNLIGFSISEKKSTTRSKKMHQKANKLAYIERAIIEANEWQSKQFLNQKKDFQPLFNTDNKLFATSRFVDLSGEEPTTYEHIGLIPRSITKTLARFQNELDTRSGSLLIQEFRLSKYQAIASLECFLLLILGPMLISFCCKSLVLQPLVQEWWNTGQSEIFINSYQQKKALFELQAFEDQIQFEQLLNGSSELSPEVVSEKIHTKAMQLANSYNQGSVDAIVNVFSDVIALSSLSLFLVVSQKRLVVVRSLINEFFYSLSDTLKAFLIILFTDMFVGFHSPHGWEILVAALLRHFGLAENRHFIYPFVATFPVILDTVFKYWIFRHLNRISPSIVVTYHTMNE